MLLNKSDLGDFAQSIAKEITNTDARVLALYGPMGSGKTAITKLVIDALGGSKEVVNSPTFNIVNEYSLDGFGAVYHYDLHRLDSAQQLDEVGLFDAIDTGRLVIIEWPELAQRYLPNECIRIFLSKVDGHSDSRDVRISYGPIGESEGRGESKGESDGSETEPTKTNHPEGRRLTE